MKPTSSPSGNSQDFELVSVEEFSLVHYKENEGWTRGVHCEGSAFSTLFALLFWDVIFFYDVPNVFRSRYQVSVTGIGVVIVVVLLLLLLLLLFLLLRMSFLIPGCTEEVDT